MVNEQPTPENTEAPAGADAAGAPAKKAPVRRTRAKKATAPVTNTEEPSLLDAITGTAQEAAAPAAADEAPAAPAKRAPRRRASSPVTAPGAASTATESPEQAVQGELALSHDASAEPATKAPARRSRAAKAPATKITAPEAPAAEPAKAPAAKTAAKATAKAPTKAAAAKAAAAKKDAAEAAASTPEGATVEPADKPAKAPARRATRKTSSPAKAAPVEAAVEPAAPVDEPDPAPESAPAAAPVRSRRRATAKAGPAATAPAANAPAEAEAEAPARNAAPAAAVAAESTPAAAAESAAAPEPAPAESVDPGAKAADVHVTESLFMEPSAGVSALFLAPDLSLAVPAAGAEEQDEQDDEGERRSRGRNRNRRARSNDAEPTESVESDDDAGHDGEEAEGTDDGVTSRRRRRRRRGDADLELTGGSDEDPPNTVTRVRAPRTPAESTSSNRVTSLRGSTRLEAKKQRRRDSRDSGRRRTVITEAEFLARRESVDRVMVVNQADDRIQIGVLEDGILAEHFVSKTQQDSLIGNVYLGKVQNVLPSMEAAFVDIGRGRNAVLYAGEVDWDAANLNGQPRRIENALKSGDSVLVQVSKDPVGHKGARLTSQISLPGRYLVFVPGGSMTGISRKLPDVERNRLKRVLKDHLPENAGVIVRTAAEGASEEELTNDINRLRAQWEGINNRASSTKTLAPEMLYAEPDLTIKVVRDVFNEDFSKLIVSGEDAWDTIEAYVTYVAPDLLDRLEKWTKPEDIFAAHRIDEQINKALERKVFLPSGGSLVIDRTEAMTVVDVNTGKFTGSGGNLEETVTKNNLEAAEEVVRQLRLRDIGGIIVIDFIDMVLESNRDLVLRRLVECLGRDRTKHQVAEVTSLGLVQMTRKRMGTGLLEVFGEQCATCAGRGMVTHEIPVEHRRTHSPAVEAAAAHTPRHENREGERTANRSTRSERKRNRNARSNQNENDAHEDSPAPVVDETTEAARAQKAHEARAALATIAAASHHEHDGGAHVSAPAPAAAHDDNVTEGSRDTATLTLGGEAIELPRGHRSESSDFAQPNNAEQVAALAGLAEALDQLVAPDQEGRSTEESGSRSRSRRSRRNRSARSAQGGADTTVETSDAPVTGTGSAPHSSAEVAAPKAEPVKKSAEPIILGVGVPASEL